jgi:hypothetical protein
VTIMTTALQMLGTKMLIFSLGENNGDQPDDISEDSHEIRQERLRHKQWVYESSTLCSIQIPRARMRMGGEK